MFQKNYAGKILECHLNLLNVIRVGGYLPDRVTNLVLQYISNSVSKTSMYNQLLPRLDVVLFEIIFPLMCFNDNDQKLWDEDPHEYVRKGYDIIEDLCSPRTAAMDFVSELVRKRGKENLQKFILFIVEIFKRYDETTVEYKPYRQKDGALLAIGALCDKLKQTEPYKSELERMLVQHVFPEFSSPVGHLRAKVDLITTFTKLSSLGQQINYEAYTYPVQKVDLSKLKLKDGKAHGFVCKMPTPTSISSVFTTKRSLLEISRLRWGQIQESVADFLFKFFHGIGG